MAGHVTPGSAAGIIYQLERVLFHLATTSEDGILVGIETADDVSIRGTDGIKALEQDKHSSQVVGHPFTDRSEALWKTLAIWAEFLSTSTSCPALFLVTNRPVPDCLARRLGKDNKSAKEIASLLEEMRLISRSLPQPLRRHAAQLFSLDHLLLQKIVESIRLYDASEGTTSSDIRRRVVAALLIPSGIDEGKVFEGLSGWLQRVVKTMWDKGEPAWISRSSLANQRHELIMSMKRAKVRARASRLIDLDIREEERQEARLHRFVEHLGLVLCDDETVDRAVDDYLRFNIEHARLIAQGDILEDHWEDRSGQLCRRWERILRRNMAGSDAADPEAIGQNVLRETADEGYCAPLADCDTHEEYLTSGHYHRLANVDRVWWHPRFSSK